MGLPGQAHPRLHPDGHSGGAALTALARDDEIVVYSSCTACPSSRVAFRLLADHGFHNVRHYAGGLLEWEEAGYPLEGDWVEHAEVPPTAGRTSRTYADDPVAFAETDALMDQLWAAQSSTGGSSIRPRAEQPATGPPGRDPALEALLAELDAYVPGVPPAPDHLSRNPPIPFRRQAISALIGGFRLSFAVPLRLRRGSRR